jgi:hypothetical protein
MRTRAVSGGKHFGSVADILRNSSSGRSLRRRRRHNVFSLRRRL